MNEQLRKAFEKWAAGGASETMCHVFSFARTWNHPHGERYLELTTELCFRSYCAAHKTLIAGQDALKQPLPEGIPSAEELEALADGNDGMLLDGEFIDKLNALARWLKCT